MSYSKVLDNEKFIMRIKVFLRIIFLSLIIISCSSSDDDVTESLVYPSFGSEIEVTINDLSFDAMEPFLSPNGNYLFFNNLNDGINTKLYYATKINDSTFNYVGELMGSNQTIAPHLDAVADMDSNGSFYWTSTRDYPDELNNLFRGSFSDGNVVTIIDLSRPQIPSYDAYYKIIRFLIANIIDFPKVN